MQQQGGIQALKVRSEKPDGWSDYIWDLTDTAWESNNEWWMGQVSFSTHKVIPTLRIGPYNLLVLVSI